MARYVAIVEYDEDDDVFMASFPDAPGCTSMGNTEEEVIANATEALAEWAADEIADGREPPEPRSYRQLLKSGDYDLGNGGMVAFVLLIRETGKLARANISIDTGLLSEIDHEANRIGITRSAFLAAAARDRIHRLDLSTKPAS